MDRKLLREHLIKQRNQLSSEIILAHSQAICTFLENSFFYQAANIIGFYFPIRNEINLLPCMQAAQSANKACVLPCLQEQHLIFREYSHEKNLIQNKYGITEPNTSANIIATRRIDIVFVPLVGFTADGHRLGMGAGYYDRTFAYKLIHTDDKPKLIGVAHELQKCNTLVQQSWDVPLDAVATEKQYYQCRLR